LKRFCHPDLWLLEVRESKEDRKMSGMILALDQGTTSSRAILFNREGNIVAQHSEPLTCTYPGSGWVEQDPQEIWLSQLGCMVAVLEKSKTAMSQVEALGITNQRETVIAWNKETGEPLYNAIVWQCRRTAAFCDELKEEGFEEVIRSKTGLLADPYFSGTKIHWILNNVPEAQRLAIEDKLAVGTVDSWLVWNLTGGKTHITDATNASRTQLYDIFKNDWDEEILNRFSIPHSALPKVVPSTGIVASTDAEMFDSSVLIAGIAGDQQAALFGQGCFEKGMAKNTYGTGCFLLMNTGEVPVESETGLLTTIAWKTQESTTYALEGSVFIAGALVQWLRDGLGLFKDVAETNDMATLVRNTGGVYIVPAFVGLGAPHWDPYARGIMVGLTRDTNRFHIVRAAIEAIAYQSFDVLTSMERDLCGSLTELRIDGGASLNNFLCQFQADLLGCDVVRPKVTETTALGAAYLAGLAVGTWKSTDELEALWQADTAFEPRGSRNDMRSQIKGWHRAVERSKNWAIG
jgi:glycerol kinase